MVILKIAKRKRSDKRPRSVADTINYAEGNRLNDGEKCLYKNYINFAPNEAVSNIHRIKTITETAALNTLCKDPIFHDIISWQEGEIPTKEQVDEVAKIYLKEMGFEDCQCVYGLHQNTNFYHLHMVVNRIHPDTNKAIDPGMYKIKHELIARTIELKQNWNIVDNGKFYKIIDNEIVKLDKNRNALEKAINQNTKDFECRSGEQSAIRIAQDNVISDFWDTLNGKVSSWTALHVRLAAKGFTIQKAGRGAVLTYYQNDKKTVIKLSSLSQKISLNKLEKCLGTFHERIPEIKISTQDAKPLIAENKDNTKYIEEKNKFYKNYSALFKKSAQFKQYKKEQIKELAKQQKNERKKLFGIKGKWKGKGKELNRQRSLLALKHLNEKQQLKHYLNEQKSILDGMLNEAKYTKFPDYRTWEEERNNPLAKWKFIYANSYECMITDQDAGIEENEDTILDTYIVKPNLQNIVFYEDNGIAFKDNGNSITILLQTNENIKNALLLAQEKWGHARLCGTMRFKRRAIEIAIKNNIEIINPELQELIQMKKEELNDVKAQAGIVARQATEEVKEHITQFNDYVSLLETENFRITCCKPNTDGSNKTFLLKGKDDQINMTQYEIQAQWNEIERLNKNGWNIYVTPIPEETKKELYILVDDLSEKTLQEMKSDGFNPTIVIESSPGNYQAIIVVEKNFIETDEKSRQINKQAANRLMQELNTVYGDKNIRAAIHPHRIPGMNNNKLKRIAENNGIAPKVNLVEINIDQQKKNYRNSLSYQERQNKKIGIGVHCEFAQHRISKYISELSRKMREEERAAAELMQRAAKAGNTGTIDPVEAFIIHAKDIMQHYSVSDYSRLDSEVVARMKATGYSHAEIKEAVEKGSPAVRPEDRRNKQWANYAEKTAKYADSFACAQKITQQEHRIGAWLALEGRTKNSMDKTHSIKHR